MIFINASFSAEVRLSCSPIELCDDISRKVNLINNKPDEVVIDEIRSIALDESVQYFKMEKLKLESEVILLTVEKKLKFGAVEFITADEIDKSALQRLLGIKEGEFFDVEIVEKSNEKIKKYLYDRGYRGIKISIDYSMVGGTLIPVYRIITPNKIILRNVKFPDSIYLVEKSYLLNILKFKSKVFHRIDFDVLVQRTISELKKQGYFDVELSYNSNSDQNFIDIEFIFSPGTQKVFDFKGNKIMPRSNLYQVLVNKFSQEGILVKDEELPDIIKNEYVKRGFYNSVVKIRTKEFVQPDGLSRKNYYFEIDEGNKLKINKLMFSGNYLFDVERIENLFFKDASDLIDAGYLDTEYLNSFIDKLKEDYLKNGLIFISVSEPRIVFKKIGKEQVVEVSYVIKEKQQTILTDIEINNVENSLKFEIISNMINKKNTPLNVVDLEKDISKSLDIVRESGYYFAKILNISDNDIITYTNNYTNSVVKIDLEIGKKSVLDNLIISGNRVTNSIVIEREVEILKGEVITPSKLKRIRDNLNSLGLFSDIQIIPYVNNRFTDDELTKINLLIQVQEKEFGSGEFAPGYRTDLGYKASLSIVKNNIMGMNHSLSWRTQLNLRSSLSDLDQRREANDKSLLEGLVRFGYSIPYVFDIVDFNISTSYQRKRFSSFDADIYEVAPQISKEFNENLTMLLKYQLEQIRQFDATEEKDQATFRIGGITPSLSYSDRDDPINPRSGFSTSLSWEFANSWFGSKKEEDLEINFSKVVSRNRFYLPLAEKSFVLAFSLSMGMQENYANEIKTDSTGAVVRNDDGSLRTKGYIPSIKVFRLDGYDNVRGFSDSEINRLGNGIDINEIRVQDKAYFTNFKFEPRYYLNDTIAFGLFFDAGRLFNGSFKPLDLRTSVGTSFKFLTPVGTLDFDYGVKTNRNYLNNGSREGFGRFHLSIGFF
tara:strand:+ start:252206 stop:255028 length:2823 start_codon:yes stop_codon:yes gene_type:complete